MLPASGIFSTSWPRSLTRVNDAAAGIRRPGCGPAEESTYRRAFALISANIIDLVLGAWLHTRATRAGGRLVIAIDGETVRGAKGKDENAPHLVAALAHGIGTVLGQVAMDAKSNEIPAVRELLTTFADLAGAVITLDALHTQGDTARVILDRHAAYVMTVKANMPTLYRQLEKLPWKDVLSVSSVTSGPGRRARRTVKAVLAPSWTGFAGAAQVAQLRRTVTKKGNRTVEVVYLITSDRDGPRHPGGLGPRPLGDRRPSSLGQGRDLSGRQVPGQDRNAPRVMASIRSLAVSLLRLDGHDNIAAANRHHARDPQRTLKLLQAELIRLCRVPGSSGERIAARSGSGISASANETAARFPCDRRARSHPCSSTGSSHEIWGGAGVVMTGSASCVDAAPA
jgi:Transposase DDE domain